MTPSGPAELGNLLVNMNLSTPGAGCDLPRAVVRGHSMRVIGRSPPYIHRVRLPAARSR